MRLDYFASSFDVLNFNTVQRHCFKNLNLLRLYYKNIRCNDMTIIALKQFNSLNRFWFGGHRSWFMSQRWLIWSTHLTNRLETPYTKLPLVGFCSVPESSSHYTSTTPRPQYLCMSCIVYMQIVIAKSSVWIRSKLWPWDLT